MSKNDFQMLNLHLWHKIIQKQFGDNKFDGFGIKYWAWEDQLKPRLSFGHQNKKRKIQPSSIQFAVYKILLQDALYQAWMKKSASNLNLFWNTAWSGYFLQYLYLVQFIFPCCTVSAILQASNRIQSYTFI